MRWGGVAPRADVIVALAVVALVLVPGAAQGRFLPPENRPLCQILIEERDEPARGQRFVTERELTFARTESGYRATITIIRADPGGSDAGAMFAAGMAGLKGQPIVFALDRDGAVLGIDDETAVWLRFCDAIAAMATGTTPTDLRRKATLAAMAATLRAAPAAQRRSMLGSMIASIVAGPLADRRPGTQPVTLPARAPDGAQTTLAGRETVTLTGGALEIDTEAEGALPGRGDGARLTLSQRQRIDAARGLVLEARIVRDSVIGTGEAARRTRSVSTSMISFKAS